MLPVVQPRALHLALVEGEAQWLDEVQRGASGEAGASGVTGIPMNFGTDEHDVNGHDQW